MEDCGEGEEEKREREGTEGGWFGSGDASAFGGTRVQGRRSVGRAVGMHGSARYGREESAWEERLRVGRVEVYAARRRRRERLSRAEGDCAVCPGW